MATRPKPLTPREGSHLVVHPLYAQFAKVWATAKDLYEGSGGFLAEDRPYIVPHPREWNDHSEKDADGIWRPKVSPTDPSPKLKMRRKLARYENVAATILDAVSGALFLQSPSRSFADDKENPQIAAWWADCDGMGTDLSTFMRESFLVAGVFGHAGLMLEKSDDEPATAADMKLPYLCRYTPLDILDWLDDGRGKLVAVKLAEIAPRAAFDETNHDALKRVRVRIVDGEEWRLYGHNAQLLPGKKGQGKHGFGELPFEILYAKRRLLTPHVGKSIMGDPQMFIDLYNLTSEVRELLRNQTFAILNVPIGDKGSVETEQQRLGSQSGTSNVLFSTNPAGFISPEGTNVAAYHEHIDKLSRMIYRLASAPWDGDSKDVESAESRQIKRAEYDQVLKTYALELQRVERRMTWLAYIAAYGDQAKAKWDADQPTIIYPTSFQTPDLGAVVEHASAAVGLDLGETAMKAIKKRVARAMLVDAPQTLIQDIDGELDAQEYLSKAEEREQMLESAAAKFQKPAA